MKICIEQSLLNGQKHTRGMRCLVLPLTITEIDLFHYMSYQKKHLCKSKGKDFENNEIIPCMPRYSVSLFFK